MTNTNPFDIHITKRRYKYYNYLSVLLYLSNFILIFGIAIINLKYVQYFIILIHISISLFLMLKFNRFIKGGITINEYEKKIIFSASFILLINIFIYQIGISSDIVKANDYISKIKSKLFDYFS